MEIMKYKIMKYKMKYKIMKYKMFSKQMGPRAIYSVDFFFFSCGATWQSGLQIIEQREARKNKPSYLIADCNTG